MSKELVISAASHERRVAILEEGQLVEIYIEREKEFALVGSIYKGKVTRVLPGMQSAFVDIGLDGDAFLYVSDVFENLEDYDHDHAHETPPVVASSPEPRLAAPVEHESESHSVELLPGESLAKARSTGGEETGSGRNCGRHPRFAVLFAARFARNPWPRRPPPVTNSLSPATSIPVRRMLSRISPRSASRNPTLPRRRILAPTTKPQIIRRAVATPVPARTLDAETIAAMTVATTAARNPVVVVADVSVAAAVAVVVVARWRSRRRPQFAAIEIRFAAGFSRGRPARQRIARPGSESRLATSRF